MFTSLVCQFWHLSGLSLNLASLISVIKADPVKAVYQRSVTMVTPHSKAW